MSAVSYITPRKEKAIRIRRSRKKAHRGFAVVFAVFLVVGLETVIAGSMLDMMRHHRQIQREAHRIQVKWAAEGIVDRALKLFNDYMQTKGGQFPNVSTGPMPNRGKVVLGNNSQITDNKTFSRFLNEWYEGTSPLDDSNTPSVSGFKDRETYADVLRFIKVVPPGIVITQLPYARSVLGPDLERLYRITVHLEHDLTHVRSQVTQEVLVNKGGVFDFAVFCEEDCEIAAGPSSSFQGPIFSNKNIYLSNDGPNKNDGSGSTTILKMADGFSIDHPQPYVIHSAGNIYFWFKRAIGENYQRHYQEFQNAVATGGLPTYYGLEHELMTFVNLGRPGSPYPHYPPVFYYFFNRADQDGTWGKRPDDNKILIETQPGGCILGLPDAACERLPHPGKWTKTSSGNFVVVGEAGTDESSTAPFPNSFSGGYGQYETQGSSQRGRMDYVFKDTFGESFLDDSNKMNLSAAIDRSDPMETDNTKPHPPLNPNWMSGSGYDFEGVHLVQDGVSRQDIVIGTPSHPSGSHVIIEPWTEIIEPPNSCRSNPGREGCYPEDTEEGRQQKLQFKADDRRADGKGLNLYIKPSDGTCSEDLQTLINKDGIVWGGVDGKGGCSIVGSMFDYRLGYRAVTYRIDIGKLISQEEYKNVEVIYIYTYPAAQADLNKPVLVRLINGSKLPKNGLTVATNGRLWIEGDYNTYDYSKGSNCPPDEWDRKQCQIPPAALFSDSFGVLSKEWQDSYDKNTPLSGRDVLQNVTVNAAISTGMLESQLERAYTPESCRKGYCGNQELVKVGEYYNRGEFFCRDDSYKEGKDGVEPSCEFYQDPVTKILYVNPKSTGADNLSGDSRQVVRYQEAMIDPSDDPQDRQPKDGLGNPIPGDKNHLLPECDPRLEADGTAADCDNIRIPIVVTPDSARAFLTKWQEAKIADWSLLEGVRPFAGVSFRYLLRYYLFGYVQERSEWVCDSTPQSCSVPGGKCPAPGDHPIYRDCNDKGDQGLLGGQCQRCKVGHYEDVTVFENVAPPEAYFAPIHWALWRPRYSGGVENLINLQERWQTPKLLAPLTLRVLGTFSVTWHSTELYDPTGARTYWRPDYYNPPVRIFDYNESLRTTPPPGTPGTFSITRKRWRESSPPR